MESLLRHCDPIVVGTILLPLAVTAAAWSLRMACAICAVRVLDFFPAAAVVVVSILANFGLRILFQSNDLPLELTTQLLVMLLTTAVIVAISVQTTVFSAVAVTITQVFLCGLMYFGVSEVSQVIL